MSPRDERDAGAGTIVAVGLVGAAVGLALLLAPVATVGIARHRATTAADAAALAAADTVVGIAAGDPCGNAGLTAAANGAALERCELDGLVATVEVRVVAGWASIAARASAGPPP